MVEGHLAVNLSHLTLSGEAHVAFLVMWDYSSVVVAALLDLKIPLFSAGDSAQTVHPPAKLTA